MEKIKCHLCSVEISKSNWSKHIKTIKHLNNIRRNNEKHCIICNVLIREDEWNNHIKSRFHKKNRKLFRKNLKKKAKPIINRLRKNISVGFEESERALASNERKHCRICNVLIREDKWNNHIKSRFHKKK
jgi:predicted nucleic acid-binding Zn ribbon protein